jgi:hypothetical protein
MAFNRDQFKGLVTRVLDDLGLGSPSAVNLLLGTAAQESGFGTYLRQISGPALGVFQMEPATELDIWNNYLKFRPTFRQDLQRVTQVMQPGTGALEWNLAYQIAMARVQYLRAPDPLPLDLSSMAHYWKRFYNTMHGKGTTDEFLTNYHRYVLRED